MTVTNAQKSSQIQAAEELEVAVKKLVGEASEIPRPSDSTDLLAILHSVQSELDRVYGALAQWHSQVEHGKHFRGVKEHADPENPGWIRADIALREAEQYGADATAALERARSANEEALWFDEIEVDEAY